MTARRRVAAAVAALGLLAAACSSSGSTSGATGSSAALSGSITVFAASSLTGSFTALATSFEHSHPGTTITFRFDASSTLASSITQGQHADVFASASTKSMALVNQAKTPVNFATNTMEIATPPGNPAHITGVADLAKGGVQVALCDPAVPCGATALAVFAKAGVTVKAVSNEPDVKATLAKVEIKEVDAAMVYVTDVRSAGAKVVGVPIPAAQNASTTYPIAVLSGSSNVPLARAWVAYVLSAAGQQVLRAAGFSAP